MTSKTWHKWSPDDILVLQTGWRNNVSAYVIAARLNRPCGAVQTKASELKLRRPGRRKWWHVSEFLKRGSR